MGSTPWARRRAYATALVLVLLLLSYPVMIVQRWPRPRAAPELPTLTSLPLANVLPASIEGRVRSPQQVPDVPVQSVAVVRTHELAGLPEVTSSGEQPAARTTRGAGWPCNVLSPTGHWAPVPSPLTPVDVEGDALLVELVHKTSAIWDFDSSLDCGGYRHFTVSQAQLLLRGKQIVFAGDSLMRKLYYEFSQSLITTTTTTFKSKKDKTIVRAEDMNLSTQFIWAPYANIRNRDLGGDTRTIFPYQAILAELFAPQPPTSEENLTIAHGEFSSHAARPAESRPTKLARLQGRTQEVGAGPAAQLCQVGIGPERHQTWDRFCARPSALILSVGLWQTEAWERNVADFSTMVRAEETKAHAAGWPALKIVALLPFPVRRIRSDVPASGLQEDPNVENQYRPEAMQGLREALRNACRSFRCCVAIDAWDAAYVRPEDSPDGRHYELRSPTLKFTLNLLLNALAADCPPV